jgi:hypothetical protein
VTIRLAGYATSILVLIVKRRGLLQYEGADRSGRAFHRSSSQTRWVAIRPAWFTKATCMRAGVVRTQTHGRNDVDSFGSAPTKNERGRRVDAVSNN